MRILYTAVETPVPGTHGGSVHAVELCRALARRGHRVDLLAPPGDRDPAFGRGPRPDPVVGVADEKGDPCGLTLHPIRRPPRFLEWSAVAEVQKLARKLRPDVIVERFYTFAGAGLWAAHRLGLPAVLEVNSPARSYPGSWRDRLDRLTLLRPVDRWRRTQLAWADGIYTTSERLLPPELQGIARVVVNGVDVERFRPGPGPAGGEPLRCVYVSSFRAWHGAADLVTAVAACQRRGVELRVECIGQGPRWKAARRLARRLGVNGMVEFVGRIPHDDVPARLARAHVGLAPFTPGAFRALRLGWFWSPIKIFEYLAAGLAVVTADLPELRQLVSENVARFYAPGDTDALAAVLAALAADREILRDLGTAARRLAEDSYTWDRQAEQVEQLLLEVVDAAATAARPSDRPGRVPADGGREATRR